MRPAPSPIWAMRTTRACSAPSSTCWRSSTPTAVGAATSSASDAAPRPSSPTRDPPCSRSRHSASPIWPTTARLSIEPWSSCSRTGPPRPPSARATTASEACSCRSATRWPTTTCSRGCRCCPTTIAPAQTHDSRSVPCDACSGSAPFRASLNLQGRTDRCARFRAPGARGSLPG